MDLCPLVTNVLPVPTSFPCAVNKMLGYILDSAYCLRFPIGEHACRVLVKNHIFSNSFKMAETCHTRQCFTNFLHKITTPHVPLFAKKIAKKAFPPIENHLKNPRFTLLTCFYQQNLPTCLPQIQSMVR